MSGTRIIHDITDLTSGDHLGWFYDTEEDHRAVITPFLRQGLERGEKVLYIVDARPPESVLAYLREDGLVVEPYLARGQLCILTSADTYLGQGVFDPDAMIALLRSETARALAGGYSALRVTGEMSWVTRGVRGSDRLIEYEAKLNAFFSESRCLGLCQYDRRRFQPELLLDMLRTHPKAVIGTGVYDNFYYVPVSEVLEGRDAGLELCRWIRNLTQRKQAEDALKESEDRYREMIDNANDIIFTCDLAWNLTSLNRVGEAITGYTRDEALTMNVAQVVAPGHVDLARQMLDRKLAEGGATTYELEIITKDGHKVLLEASTRLIYREGVPVGVQGIARDITERKQAEADIQSLAKFSSENPSPVLRIAGDGTLLYINPAGVSLLPDWHLQVGQAAPPALQEAVFQSINNGTMRVLDLEYGERMYSFFVAPVVNSGYTNLYGRDITEHKRAERERERLFEQVRAGRERLQILSARLVEAQETERRYIAGELHDEIGQALTAIKLNLHAMTRLSDDGRLAKLLKGSVEVIDRALQQTRTLSFDLRPRMLDDLGLLPALRWLVDQRARQAGLETQVVADLPEGRLPSLVETACFRVAQEALTNVLRHARARSVRLEVRQRGAALEMSIHDDGIGFDVKIARKGATQGTSFGLLGMEERVHLAGGQIEIDSASMRGTTIRARLPLTPSPSSTERSD